MSLFSRIKQKAFSEFTDIIEWTDDTAETIIWRFPWCKAGVKNGAQLTVRETQVAVLVNDGQFADVYHPGCYELTTNNMPILTTLKRWKHGFNSTFKVDVYFVNTKQFLNMSWGTTNPILMDDPEFGPIRIRAFGSYCFRVKHDPIVFIRNVAGTDGDFTNDSVTLQLRNFVITKFTDYLAESKIATLDLAANMNEFSSELLIALKDDFSDYGIKLTKFLVESISLPEVVERALDKHTSMAVVGDMTTYMQMQFADFPKNGAGNATDGRSHADDPMGASIDLGMDGKMAQQTVDSKDGQQSNNLISDDIQQGEAPRMPSQKMYHVAVEGVQHKPFSMAQLQQMVQQGQLTPNTLVWTIGMKGWSSANSVPSLTQLFCSTPPPL